MLKVEIPTTQMNLTNNVEGKKPDTKAHVLNELVHTKFKDRPDPAQSHKCGRLLLEEQGMAAGEGRGLLRDWRRPGSYPGMWSLGRAACDSPVRRTLTKHALLCTGIVP